MHRLPPPRPSPHSPRRPFLPVAIGLTLLTTCATLGGKNSAHYPPRPPGCRIALYHTATPDVPVWDDIGIAEVGCYLDEGEVACLRRLRAEGCRMGGDIIYNVPKRPLRPEERAIVFRGQVAHTRALNKNDKRDQDDDSDGGQMPGDKQADKKDRDAPAETGPVVPIPTGGGPSSGGATAARRCRPPRRRWGRVKPLRLDLG
jgi:hypothetical protein